MTRDERAARLARDEELDRDGWPLTTDEIEVEIDNEYPGWGEED
jgi:hypothetical protein